MSSSGVLGNPTRLSHVLQLVYLVLESWRSGAGQDQGGGEGGADKRLDKIEGGEELQGVVVVCCLTEVYLVLRGQRRWGRGRALGCREGPCCGVTLRVQMPGLGLAQVPL